MAHPDSIIARDRKAEHAATISITEKRISELVTRFYDRVRRDTTIGPIFNDRVSDWSVHLPRMVDFWISIAIESGRFHGNPMLKHIVISEIDKNHFDHWLKLFDQTLSEVMPTPESREFFSNRASRIAKSLMTGISLHKDGLEDITQKGMPTKNSAAERNR